MKILTRAFGSLFLLTGIAVLTPGTAQADVLLKAARVAPSRAMLDPDAKIWSAAREAEVAMQPQTVVAPMDPDPAVTALKVRAIHDGKWLALRMQWSDPTRSDVVMSDRFGDQVAVEFPINGAQDALPSPMMGNSGARVNILQWRAALEHDLRQGAPSVRSLYPNAQVDIYPDQLLSAADAKPYTGALAFDNPVSRAKSSPVLDQVAEGWSTITVKPEQHADGHGRWRNRQWAVVIALPLYSRDPNAPALAPGSRTSAAFAVWEGGHREVGSRKSWSDWVAIELSK